MKSLWQGDLEMNGHGNYGEYNNTMEMDDVTMTISMRMVNL